MASDLISRDALIEDCLNRLNEFDMDVFAFENCFPYWIFKKAITKAPTADAEPVRHGEWVKMVFTDTGEFAGYKCSECGLIAKRKFSYCHCGAKMDGGKQDGKRQDSPW